MLVGNSWFKFDHKVRLLEMIYGTSKKISWLVNTRKVNQVVRNKGKMWISGQFVHKKLFMKF